jgi:hypothetical protein
MIDGEIYIKLVKAYFSYLGLEFGFSLLEDKVWGNSFYSLKYSDEKKVVSISYENIEDHFTVIFLLKNGQRVNYDKKDQTLHFAEFIKKMFSIAKPDEIRLNNLHFLSFKPASTIEKKLLKTAKELRLCLNFFDKILAL